MYYRLIQMSKIQLLKQAIKTNNLTISHRNRTLLHQACIYNNLKALKILLTQLTQLEPKDDLNWTPIQWCLNNQNQKAINLFANYSKKQSLKKPLRNNVNKLSIFDAIERKENNRLKQILSNKKIVMQVCKFKQKYQRTLLHFAALVGNVEAWYLLIQLGCSNNVQDYFHLKPSDYIHLNPSNKIKSHIEHIPKNPFLHYSLKQKQYDVIIVGAGAGGIGAAKILHGKTKYIVLEARNRIGGRCFSEKIGSIQIDVGASWIHSYNHKNPIRKQVEILRYPLKKNIDQGKNVFLDESGQQLTDDNAMHFAQQYMYFMKKCAKKSKKDLTIYEAGKYYYQNFIQYQPQKLKKHINMILHYTQNYQAASIKELSAKHYDDQSISGGDQLPLGSYHQLLTLIAQGLNFRVNAPVKSINYSSEQIKVTLRNKQELFCKKIIVNLPLGILKSKAVEFIPEFPLTYSRVIQRLGFGLMNKVILQFEQRFWNKLNTIIIACSHKGKFPFFIDFSLRDTYILISFITDEFARQLTHVDSKQIAQQACQLLFKAYGKKSKLLNYIVTKWQNDDYSKGSYSYFGVNSSMDDCDTLSFPIDNRLWLVGQHVYADCIGTVHGAFTTGQQAGKRVLDNDLW